MDKFHEVVKRCQRERNKSLRTVLITFWLVICILIMNGGPSFANIAFDLAKPIGEAKCIQWQIQTQKPYSVSLWLKDMQSRSLRIYFDTEKDDGYENNGTTMKITVGIGDEYYDNTIRTYRSGSLVDLVRQYLPEIDSTAFTFDDSTQITAIFINGAGYKFYSLDLYADCNSSDPTWERNASDWKNYDDFEADGGAMTLRTADDSSKEDIQFDGSYIYVTIQPNPRPASIYPSVIFDDTANPPSYTNPSSYQNYFPQLSYPSYSPQPSYPSYSPQLSYPSYSPLPNSLSYLPMSSSASYFPQSGITSFPASTISQPYNYNYYRGSNSMQPYAIGYSYNIGYFGYGFSSSYGGTLLWW
jgi:hypothetical protein